MWKDTHVQYGKKSPISSDKKVMAKVKVFSKVGQGNKVKNYGSM